MALTVFLVPRGVNFLASVSLSSLFKAKDKIEVVANKQTVISGEKITLTWNGPIHTDGTYSLSYPCKTGISATFHSGETIACDKAFYFSSADNSVSFSFKTTVPANTDVPVYINYKDIDGNTSIVGDTLITVLGLGSKPTTVIPTKPTTTNNNPAPTTTPTTATNETKLPTDLAVHIIDIGSINNNNVFTPGISTTGSDSRPAVRFEVINVGEKISGPWTLKALLPSISTPIYQSGFEPSLASGDRVELTLGFDIKPQGGDVTISANDNHAVIESNYQNNIVTYHINGSPAGKDLSARVSNVGSTTNGHTTFKFIVTNAGQEPTGVWNFKATLPSQTEGTYTSGDMASLAPGASTELTISFDNLQTTGNNTATIILDPNNTIVESNESNNTLSVVVR